MIGQNRVQQAGEKAAKYAAASRSKATLRGINVTGRTSRPVRPRTIDNPRRRQTEYLVEAPCARGITA
jgi:hypothetical protein